ncbi:MAG: LysR family transcriptional regulator [Aestuariibacter sp.]
MKDLSNAFTFVAVAQERSFVAAANKLGMSSSAVSKAVSRLESDLKVKLLHRTTRSVSLTPEGESYLRGIVAIANDLDNLNQYISSTNSAPFGQLKVSLPPAYGRTVVLPQLHHFYAKYPDITLELSFESRPINLAESSVDLVVRSNKLPDSANLVARKLSDVRQVICATPEYLARIGGIDSVDDLEHHNVIVMKHASKGRRLPLQLSGNRTLTVEGNLCVDDAEAKAIAVKHGLGVGQLFEFFVEKELQDGTLVEVLPEQRPSDIPLYIMYLDRKLVSPRIRAFIDFLDELTKGKF